MFNNQGNSTPSASHSENDDMVKEWEELEELEDVQLATIVGGRKPGEVIFFKPLPPLVGPYIKPIIKPPNKPTKFPPKPPFPPSLY